MNPAFQKLFLLAFLANTLLLAGCQSIPPTADRAAVMQRLQERISYAKEMQTPQQDTNVLQALSRQSELTEETAVSLALWNNAAFQELLVDLDIARADLVNTGLLPNPELLYSFSMADKPYRYAIDLPIQALWLRPIRIRSMKSQAEAVSNRLTQAGLNLIRDVRQSYAQAVLAQERQQVAKESFALRDRIAGLAQKRLHAGDITGQEALTARIDALQAQRDVERAAYDIQIAAERLYNLLGSNQPVAGLKLSSTVLPTCELNDMAILSAQAVEQRPDVMAADDAIAAAKENARLSKIGWLGIIGSADATSGEKNGHVLGPSVRVPLPLLNRNQGAISRAEAELERATRNLHTVKQQATLDVRQSHAQYQQSCNEWQLLDTKLMPAVHKTIALAQKAYEEGDIAYLLVLEANRQLLDNRLRQVQLKSDLLSLWAELERSVGKRLNTAATYFHKQP